MNCPDYGLNIMVGKLLAKVQKCGKETLRRCLKVSRKKVLMFLRDVTAIFPEKC